MYSYYSHLVYSKLDRELTEGSQVVATVRATNAAGLSTVAFSSSVLVRTAAPAFSQVPILSSVVNSPFSETGFSPSRTALRASWRIINDNAVEYRLRLVSDDGSEAPVMRNLGQFSTQGVTLTDLNLHDGNSYTAQGEA
jgi:hypothetical protein